MKIVKVDNFGSVFSSDELICENVNPHYGKAMIRTLNNALSGRKSKDFFMLVGDDYELYEANLLDIGKDNVKWRFSNVVNHLSKLFS